MEYLIILGDISKKGKGSTTLPCILATDSKVPSDITMKYEDRLERLGLLDSCKLVHTYEEVGIGCGLFLGNLELDVVNELLRDIKCFKIYGMYSIGGNVVKLSEKGRAKLGFIWQSSSGDIIKTTVTKRISTFDDWSSSNYKRELMTPDGRVVCTKDMGITREKQSDKDINSAMNLFNIIKTMGKNYKYVI